MEPREIYPFSRINPEKDPTMVIEAVNDEFEALSIALHGLAEESIPEPVKVLDTASLAEVIAALKKVGIFI